MSLPEPELLLPAEKHQKSVIIKLLDPILATGARKTENEASHTIIAIDSEKIHVHHTEKQIYKTNKRISMPPRQKSVFEA